MSILERFLSNYKPLIAVPVIITLIAVALIATHGVTENIDLKGGSNAVIQLEKPISSSDLQNIIAKGINNNQVDVTSIANNQATIQISGPTNVSTFVNAISGTGTLLSFQSVGALLSSQALSQVYYALAFAFLFMSITVFIVFRNIVPSVAVILAALTYY
jgi:preprotein translocase subunit SecF